MTIEQRLGCEFVGLSTDSKPDHAGLLDFRFIESDTGTIYHYPGAAWNPIIGANAALTITNKTLSALDNDFKNNSAVDFPLSFGYKRSGSIIPAVGLPYTCGAFGGMAVTVGSGENAFSALDSVEGNYQNFRGNLTTEKMGLQSTTTTNSLITTRGQNPYVAVRCRVDAAAGIRMWIGYTSLQTLPVSNTILGSADSGVIIGFGSATTNYTAYYNDGTGTAATTDLGIAKDNSWHTFEIAMSITTASCTIDGGTPALLTTQIPNTSTNLYFNCVVQYV